ncbi:MAG: hypothetical protein Q4C02_02645 [Eubacteriales bacterium]|nr:hypothetical protein [Sarcina sp.]MDO4417161.1 hypothetical protein [Eubacteriales bacterium]
MSFIDIVYRILAQGYSPSEYGGAGILVAMLASMVLSIYIYLCYRMEGRRTFYSLSLNLALLVSGPVTCALILMMHQHAIASVGVVGALSIIRLRGAVKEPMDLVFVLWSVACGIFIAAGMWRVGIVVSILMTAVVIVMDLVSPGRAPLILAVYGHEGEKPDLEKICKKTIVDTCDHVKLISTGKVEGRQNLVLRVRTKQRLRLTNELARLPEVDGVTLLEQGGEVSY